MVVVDLVADAEEEVVEGAVVVAAAEVALVEEAVVAAVEETVLEVVEAEAVEVGSLHPIFNNLP